jgi:two-component system phosphate regulon sensor histidine kinase PhoR
VRFFWKLLAGMTLAVVATAWVSDLRVSSLVEQRRLESVRERVREDAFLVSRLAMPHLLAGDTGALQELADQLERHLAGRRITIIAADGAVLADSHELAPAMGDHGSRPELLDPGSVHERVSDTLGRELMYVAHAMAQDGRTLGHARVALDTSRIRADGDLLRDGMLLASFLALAVGLVLAFVISGRVSRPLQRITGAIGALGRGDYHRRLVEEGAAEIRNMAEVVNDVGLRLEEREARIVAEVGQKAAILSAMDEGLVALDRDLRVVLLNDAARTMLDPERREGVGVAFADLTNEPEFVLAARECLERGARREGEIGAQGGEDAGTMAYVVTPVLDPSGEAEMAVLVLRDVTALRRLEQVRRDFVANVSHELKTPLTTMRGYLEAVLDDPAMDVEQRRAFLEKAGRSTARLTAIVSDLLDLARLERSIDELEGEPVELGPLVADCVRSIQPDAEERLVRVDMHLERTPAVVIGDDQSLVAAVTNLLVNAVKYSPEDGVVDVSLRTEGGVAWLRVADQGPGIPYDAQERVFERFYRVDKDRSRQLGGTGLGLSIVRNVVQAHGGQVWVESTPGEGSRFHMQLPLSSDA